MNLSKAISLNKIKILSILLLIPIFFFFIPNTSATLQNFTAALPINTTSNTANAGIEVGWKVVPNFNILAYTLYVNASSGSQASRALIRNQSNDVIVNVSINSLKADFGGILLQAGKNYSIVVTNYSGAWNTSRSTSASTFPYFNETFNITRIFDNGGSEVSGSQSWWVLRLFQFDITSNPGITLNSPSNNSLSPTNPTIFNATIIPYNESLINATLFVWNSTNSIINISTINLTGISPNDSIFSIVLPQSSLGLNKWNVLACSNLSTSVFCDWGLSNYTFTAGNFTEEFSPNVTEGQNIGVNLNITFAGIDTTLQSALVWNNTLITPSKYIIDSNTIRFSSNFIVPIGTGNSTGKSITHYWKYWLPDNSLNSTTSNQSQLVFSLNIDNCSVLSNLLFNYTMYDQDSLALINGTALNGSIQVLLSATSISDPSQNITFNKTYSNTNNALICISSITNGFRIDSQAKYTANGYVVQFYNTQNATLSASQFPQNIRLYPLLTTRSQEFLVTFLDNSFLPVNNALITMTRKYVGEGIFRTVEAPLTDSDGQTITHLVLGDEIYTIIVSKDGQILGTFSNIIPYCTDIATGQCTINLNQFSSGTSPTDFTTRNNLTYNINLNTTTRILSSTFTTLDGSVADINLTAFIFDNRGNNTACSTFIPSVSAGTINCNIPISVGNTTIRAILYKNNNYVDSRLFSLDDSSNTGFGYTGILMALIMYITIPLMMISSGAGIVIGAILGIIFAALFNLYNAGGIIGVGATAIWFIIAGAIILWKINSLRER